jgi:hypothetical protein
LLTEDLAHLGLILSRLALMVQAAVLDSQLFDLSSPFNDGGVPAEVDADRERPSPLKGAPWQNRAF